ncbi:hypothetical protein DL546_000868 [Coniochaeta pulveracea]|uniref:Rhodopsin domain-containing protein n=1 Tax=Coniochaeta pulveracea TaxID=177199 RepID=A0A420Y866_9PEZI|nr:hypothetical protein DL546_000868 [Coniochaeta pulveracea]
MKAGTLEFLSRLKPMSRQKTFSRVLWTLRGTLVVTFLVVVISDLAECQPVAHYWQVLPDPGPRCRQGYASLLTTTVCNVLTELLLVAFPIPILLTSRIPGPRKAMLIALFCLGLFTVVVSIRRVPQIISEKGYQSTRTMWASCEILVATVAANTLALASFVRDLGAKKAKFKINPYFSSSSQKRAAPIYETWNDRASIDENGTAFGHSANIKSNKTNSTEMQNMGESKSRGPSPTWSQDSLIPKGQKNQNLSQVTKTTEIEVTVEEIGGIKRDGSLSAPISRLTRREPSPSVPASERGQARGSTVLLHEMDRFPGQQRDKDGV